jgi:hypothetical protein
MGPCKTHSTIASDECEEGMPIVFDRFFTFVLKVEADIALLEADSSAQG